MKLLLALVVGLFIGYYAHDLRDKKSEIPADEPKLPGTVSFNESLQMQSDYIDNSPENAAVYFNLTKENIDLISAVCAYYRHPRGINVYLARDKGENDKLLLVPYGMSVDENSGGDKEDGEDGEEESVFVLTQRDPICPPICDAASPYKYR